MAAVSLMGKGCPTKSLASHVVLSVIILLLLYLACGSYAPILLIAIYRFALVPSSISFNYYIA